MGRRTFKVLAAVVGAATWISCSSSTEAAPSVSGTWHAKTNTLGGGTVTPSTFDVVVAQVGASWTGTLPSMSYNSIAMSGGDTVYVSHDTIFGYWINADTTNTISACDPPIGVGFVAKMNAARDTAIGIIAVGANPKYPPPQIGVCDEGSFKLTR